MKEIKDPEMVEINYLLTAREIWKVFGLAKKTVDLWQSTEVLSIVSRYITETNRKIVYKTLFFYQRYTQRKSGENV